MAKSKEGARYQLKMVASETLGLFLNYAARRETKHAFDLAAMLVGYGFSVSGQPQLSLWQRYSAEHGWM